MPERKWSVYRSPRALRRGEVSERVTGGLSLHTEERPELCPAGHGTWRVVRCNDDTDIIECPRCGAQREAECDFDGEYV